ncbi:MAG: SoxR reducing system RseC family protein [Clostridia bacterium]|nr:SoxR reducing system RseC family protein [Clostridia bacterium]
MRQIGIIQSNEGTHAAVTVRRMSACEGCHKANPGMNTDGEVTYSACHECSMFPVDEELTVTARNEIGADVGDRVVLESSSERILGYAAAVFLLPILLAAVLGCVFAALIPTVWSAYLGAAVGFVGAFLIVKFVVDRHAKEKTVYHIVRIMTTSKGFGTPDEYSTQETETMEH